MMISIMKCGEITIRFSQCDIEVVKQRDLTQYDPICQRYEYNLAFSDRTVSAPMAAMFSLHSTSETVTSSGDSRHFL